MYQQILFCLIVVISIAVNAQTAVETINIRGKVINDDKAIAGAVVTLLGQGMTDTTDDKGEYEITKNIVGVIPSIVPQRERITFGKGILQLNVPKFSSVKIEIFDMQGNLISKQGAQKTPAGVYRMNLTENFQASRLLIIQASIGGITTTFRYLPLHKNRYMISTHSKNAVSRGEGKLAKVAAVVDSLEVVKDGFDTKVVTVESFDTIVDISLDSASTGSTSEFVEDAGYDCEVTSPSGSNGGSSNAFPDPFTKWDGTQVKTMADWRCRRRELLVELENRILGPKAPPPAEIGGTVTGSISNTEYTVKVDNPKGSTSFGGKVHLPKAGSAPYPAVIVVNIQGFGTHSLVTDVLESEGVAWMEYFDPYGISSEGAGDFTKGKYFDANPDYKGKTGALVAWGWGVSRIIDMLEQNPDVIDPTKIGIHGCSRFGKAAFVIGAFDQRIALGLPLEPGTGGPAPLRALMGGQSLSSCNSEASWFGPMAGSYSANMAVDMDDVAILYAPRGLLLMDNSHISHLSFKSNYLGCAVAMEVYKAMGKEDALWYLGNSNIGDHCAVRKEYGDAQKAMYQKFFKGNKDVTTGGLDKHSNHGNVDANSWTSSWKKGTISE